LLTGTGNITNATFDGLDIEATSVGFYHALTGGTHNYAILGGRCLAAGNQYGFRVDGGTSTIELSGVFGSGGRAALVNGGTNTVRSNYAKFIGGLSVNVPIVDMAAGSGTWDWGNSIVLNGGSGPGYEITGGTMTSRGRVLRQDLIAAPSTEQANIGEYMVLSAANVTATEWGYYCTAADTWTSMPLV